MYWMVIIMLEQLKKEVYEANMLLPKYGLVMLTWGNVSGMDRKSGLFVIKPSGVEYNMLKPEDMVVVDLNGNVVEGKLRPSSDTETHRILYKAFPHIGGITHTHSHWATCFAQAGKGILSYGTTHADYFYGDIPCTRDLMKNEIEDDYELNTGKVIEETFRDKGINPEEMKAVLVKRHGPFTWGKNSHESVESSIVLEEIAKMAYHTEKLSPNLLGIDNDLLKKHYYRKHGDTAYYGQK